MRAFRLLTLAALLAAPASSAAAERPITGKLAKNGFTVIALGYDGATSSARVGGGRFSIGPRAAVVTLHLRDAAGEYVGPVVVGRKGKRAVVGIRAGARLGKLRLAKGYAKPVSAVRRALVDRGRTAVTKKGRPIGAGRFGLVRARAVGAGGPGGDLDLDGVASAFDIDDDGDLVLDNNDRDVAAGVRQEPPPPPPPGDQPPPGGQPPGADDTGLRLFSNFHFDVDETLNANAGGVTRQQIDDAMTAADSFVGLVFFLPQGHESAELDCGGLTYCTAGGTGRSTEPYPDGRKFPEELDDDGDGLGTITAGGSTGDFQLRTFAPSSAIGSGDTFVEILSDGTQISGSLNYMFNTTPAVRSYVDGSGAGATVSYPAGAQEPGTATNPLPLRPDAAGDYTLELTLWRPQRMGIPEAGEPDGFMDIGGLKWQLTIPNAPQSLDPAVPGTPNERGVSFCNTDTGWTSTDPNFERSTQNGFLIDTTADAPADPTRTLTAKANLSKCLAQAGQKLQPGYRLTWEVQANSTAGDVSAQGWWVCVPSPGRQDCRQQQPGPPPQP